jgi:hypothetical protein
MPGDGSLQGGGVFFFSTEKVMRFFGIHTSLSPLSLSPPPPPPPPQMPYKRPTARRLRCAPWPGRGVLSCLVLNTPLAGRMLRAGGRAGSPTTPIYAPKGALASPRVGARIAHRASRITHHHPRPEFRVIGSPLISCCKYQVQLPRASGGVHVWSACRSYVTRQLAALNPPI